jgi:hypothetical protein
MIEESKTGTAVELRFTYTEAEQVRAAQLYYEAVMHVRRDAAGAVLLLLLGMAATTSQEYRILGWALIALSVICLALIAYVCYFRPRQMYRSDPTLTNEYHLVFEDSGIRFRTKDIDSKLGWDLYQAAYRDRNLIILQHGKRTMTVLPLRAFANADEARRFVGMVTRHIADARLDEPS